MESLTTNDEQTLSGAIVNEDGTANYPVEEEGGGDLVVTSRREFFQEADEVRILLRRVTEPSLDTRACREACGKVGAVWAQYQEQPGLLDPFMEEMVSPLMAAISSAVHQEPKSAISMLPNLHLLSSLLYILTTVRGYKTVSRFFSHEAADLEPCLEAAEAEVEAASQKTDSWSTLYCLTLWLGMILLTPFDLESIDSGGAKGLSTRIFELGLAGLRSTSRTRDASAWMLAKYFTRPDVTVAGSLQSFLQWTREAWAPAAAEGAPAGAVSLSFVRCGAMQAWNQTLKSAPRSVLKPVWLPLVDLALQGPGKQGDADFKASSALRKLRVHVACRTALTALPPRLAPWRYDRGARSLLVNFSQATGGGSAAQMFTSDSAIGQGSSFGPPARAKASAGAEVGEEEEGDGEVPEQVEQVVELLLSSLSDSDTVVRWAAAKGVGRITNRLMRDFADQVLESLLDRCFSFRETDKAWHGGCLALAELTRRGLLLPERLSTVVPLVCQALHFEQVSGNHAVGQHVRDAACYVCWAFARAYAPDVLEPFVAQIASSLIQVAVFDREINCRRAAAAAVQEHVGRQGTFPNGIDVVTYADYWTLSARRHAYLVVAPQLAALGGGTYRLDLINHLVDRKLAHQDVQIRILAGQALSKLAEGASGDVAAHLNGTVLPKLLSRALTTEAAAAAQGDAARAAGGGLTTGSVQSRHGAVLGVAALTAVLQESISAENQASIRNLVPSLEKLRAYRGRGGEVVRQAACSVLGKVAAASSWPFKEATSARYLQTIDECTRHTTDAIQVAAADALRVLAAARFTKELATKCLDNYLEGLRKPDETIAARRGFVLCLGMLPTKAFEGRGTEVLGVLSREIKNEGLPGGKDQDDPQTRVHAVLSLGRLCFELPASTEDMAIVLDALEAAMKDYATDRRGDVGSWVREVALEIVAALLEAQRAGLAAPRVPDRAASTRLVALLLQQAVEKIDRLRERAFALLRRLMLGCSSTRSQDANGVRRPTPARCVELAYRRVCHGESYRPESGELDGMDLPEVAGAVGASSSSVWPPEEPERLADALRSARGLDLEETEAEMENEAAIDPAAADKLKADRSAAIFEALVPLLGCPAYLPSIVLGLVVSMGGITEFTARGAKGATLQFVQDAAGANASRCEALCGELLRIFSRTSPRDADAEGRRLLAPLYATVGILLAQDCFPVALAPELLQRSLAASRTSKDISRLLASIRVFIGLLRWPGAERREAMGVLLQFLGYSFPIVRQATAQALYIRLLEEAGDFDLSGTGAVAVVPASAVLEVSELITVTPWSTDNEEVLVVALRQVYEKLGMDLPTAGRSFLAPKKPKVDTKPKEADYADLVRQAHY